MFNLFSANFYVKPGNGGNGSNAFTLALFNKKIYHGGSGGNGGNIVFKYSENILINNNFNTNRIYAENGYNGKHGKKNGKNGEDKIIMTSQICSINLVEENVEYKINKDNKLFLIKGGAGGLGSRYTKNLNYNSSGQISKVYKVSIRAILPGGICHIFRKYDIESHNKIKNLFGYNCNINHSIICLNKDANNHYIFFIDEYKSVELIKFNLTSIKKIVCYAEMEYDRYNIIHLLRSHVKDLQFSN